jgi:hypothetical protein
MIVGNHYYSIPFRTKTDIQTKIQYKDRVVNKCENSDIYVSFMKTSSEVCREGSKSLTNFSVDDRNRPKFQCN